MSSISIQTITYNLSFIFRQSAQQQNIGRSLLVMKPGSYMTLDRRTKKGNAETEIFFYFSLSYTFFTLKHFFYPTFCLFLLSLSCFSFRSFYFSYDFILKSHFCVWLHNFYDRGRTQMDIQPKFSHTSCHLVKEKIYFAKILLEE